MKKNIFPLLVLGSLLVALFIGTAFQLNGNSKTETGKIIYLKNCASCHKKNGKGVPRVFPPLAGSDFIERNSKEEIIKIVLEGKKGNMVVNGLKYNNIMPSFKKKLSDSEIAAVITYVTNNFGNETTEYHEKEIRDVKNKLK